MPDEIAFTDIYVDDAIHDRVDEVLDSTRYVKGPVLEDFEKNFAAMCGADHGVGVSSGTAALYLALSAAEIGVGDDVLVPAHTFFATASSVLARGANPVFVDCDPETYTIDIADLERKAADAGNPQGVVPVHLYGQPADMDGVENVAADHDLTVIEDAAQAHGAEFEGERVGSLGDIGCFSFYPSKNMTVGGDGGMVVTDHEGIAESVRALRDHGRNDDGTHVELGLNFRLGEIGAAIGDEQLGHLHEWNKGRRAAATRYTRALAEIDEVVTPIEYEAATHVYHLYVIRVPDRDALAAHLDAAGIETVVHYPTPAHCHPAIEERAGDVEGVAVADRLADEVLSLPMHPRITHEEIDRVCETIGGYYGDRQ